MSYAMELMRAMGPPSKIKVGRDGDRDLAFTGWYLEGGTQEYAGGDREVTVHIMVTAAGRIVTSVLRVDHALRTVRETAAVHDDPEAALRWLIEDAGGKLGPATKQAWRGAADLYPPLLNVDVEEVD